MPGEPIPPRPHEPYIVLVRWRVFETDEGMRRLVGYQLQGDGCVSTALASFDNQALRATTLDGLRYQLFGAPGWFWDVVDVWDRRVDAPGGGATKDVTDELLSMLSSDTKLDGGVKAMSPSARRKGRRA